MRQPKEDVLIILVASSILLSALTASFSAASDTLNTSRPLYDGETLVSNGGAFALGFFSPDSNSSKRYVGIWYHSISSHDVVWVANSRNPVPDLSGSLTLTHNGTLVIVAGNESSKVIIWYSSGPSNGNAAYANQTAQLLDSGNLVVRADYATAGEDDTVAYTWQSFDYPSNTLLPGMAIGWDLRKGLNRNVTSWASMTDPSPGAYTVAINLGDVPQLVEIKGHSLYWRGGPWVSKGFTGLPQISAYNVAMVAFIATREEVSYNLKPGNGLLRMKLNPDGTVLRLGWLNPPGKWSLFWMTPKDQCDAYSPCGTFGVCNPDDLPVCSCLRGFRAKKQGRWTLLEVTDGCVRNTALDCRRNGTQSTDGFLLVSGVKLPDTSAAMADGSLGLDDCRKRCLMNCSCTAYSLTDVITGGSGCIMWSGELNDTRMFSQGGQDLYVRVAAADDVNTSNGKGKNKSKVALVMPILGSLIAGFILISCLIICHHGKRKKRFCKVSRDGNDIDLPLLDLETIAEATNDFSDENKLGEGGFGPVYKGRRKEDGKEIAVKRLSKSSTQGFDEFKNEILLIAKLQHRNLVRLLGCCIQRQERILIYEYMPNKSLDTFLFDKEKKSLLNWPTRYGIIIGIARGLVYLHQDSVIRVVHRDLKASNILLSQEMEPKISDFGLARIFGGDEAAKSQTKTVVGTHGYMSPEYLMDGIFSVKSDVFSFGVLVLEVISNQRNRGFSPFQDKNIVEQAWSLWKEGRALELVDESMGNSLIIAQVFRCIKVGLLCVQEQPDQRPLMSSVILMLTGDNELLPDPEPPGFIARRHSFVADHLSLSNQESELSINLVTLTMPHYR